MPKEIVTGLSLSELQSFDGFIAVCPSSCEVFPRFALPLILTCISEHLGTALLALSARRILPECLGQQAQQKRPQIKTCIMCRWEGTGCSRRS